MAAAMTAKAPLKKQTDAVAASTVGAGGPLSAPPTLTQQDDALSRLPPDITSPHELTDWVDAVLDRLESRFQSANQQYEMRMQEMSDRIDTLESSIQNLINGAVGTTTRQGSVSSTKGSEVYSPRQE